MEVGAPELFLESGRATKLTLRLTAYREPIVGNVSVAVCKAWCCASADGIARQAAVAKEVLKQVYVAEKL